MTVGQLLAQDGDPVNLRTNCASSHLWGQSVGTVLAPLSTRELLDRRRPADVYAELAYPSKMRPRRARVT